MSLFGDGEFWMWILCWKTERREFYCYFCLWKYNAFLCSSFNIGKIYLNFVLLFLCFHKHFILILYCVSYYDTSALTSQTTRCHDAEARIMNTDFSQTLSAINVPSGTAYCTFIFYSTACLLLECVQTIFQTGCPKYNKHFQNFSHSFQSLWSETKTYVQAYQQKIESPLQSFKLVFQTSTLPGGLHTLRSTFYDVIKQRQNRLKTSEF
jgi:hypothetical protein